MPCVRGGVARRSGRLGAGRASAPAHWIGVLSRNVNDFELEAVAVAEEHRVISRVRAVLGGRVDDVAAELPNQSANAVDLGAIGGVEREVMKLRREAVVLWCVAVLVGDGGQDQPLTPGRRIAPLRRSAVVAWDLHPSELGQQRVIEALADRGSRTLACRWSSEPAAPTSSAYASDAGPQPFGDRARASRDERRPRLEPKRRADRDHRRPARVDGVDDLGVVDALEVARRDGSRQPHLRGMHACHASACR